MSEFEMNAEDRQILLAADELYYLDWRENDDDENTAGWRHPGYFMEVNQPYDFSKLVEAGLMEKRETLGYVSYRITQLGAVTARTLHAQPPAAETGARGDDLVMLDFDELLTNLSGKLDSTAISILRTYFAAEHSMRTGAEAELASVRSQLAAAEAANERLANALEPFAEAWLQVPYGLRSSLRIWNGELDEDSKYPIIGSISTDTLQDAHTAWAGLPEANGSGEGAG